MMQTPEQLAHDLRRAARLAQSASTAVVRANAAGVRQSWRDSWKGIRSKPKIHRVITYETQAGPGYVEAEIGVDKRIRGAGGSLAHIIEFGSASGNAPRNDGGKALLRQAPEFIAQMGALAGMLLAPGGPVGITAEHRDPARFNS